MGGSLKCDRKSLILNACDGREPDRRADPDSVMTTGVDQLLLCVCQTGVLIRTAL